MGPDTDGSVLHRTLATAWRDDDTTTHGTLFRARDIKVPEAWPDDTKPRGFLIINIVTITTTDF